MRTVLLKTMSLMLFAAVVSQSPIAFAQRLTCALGLKVIEPNKSEVDLSNPITGARAIATRLGSRKPIPADMVEGQPMFGDLTDGDYRITITKRGFKRTVQPISFICVGPSQDTLMYIKLERGSSAQTVTNEKLTVKAGVVISSTDLSVPAVSSPRTVDVPATKWQLVISKDLLNDNAASLPQPADPAIARVATASGIVTVQVIVNEAGKVSDATSVSGHPLLRAAAVQAAREAKFLPMILEGQSVRVWGVISYEFELPQPRESRVVTE